MRSSQCAVRREAVAPSRADPPPASTVTNINTPPPVSPSFALTVARFATKASVWMLRRPFLAAARLELTAVLAASAR